MDTACFQDSHPLLGEVYVHRALSQNSNITGSKKVVEVAKVFVKETKGLTSKRMADSCTVPSGPVPVQIFLCI